VFLRKGAKVMQDNQQIEIRDTIAADIPKLRAMHGQSWLDTYPSPENGVTREWVEERIANWVIPEGIAKSQEHFKEIFGQPNHLHQIAVDGDGEVAGIVHISKDEHGQHLQAIYIDKRYFGTGLAQRLMDIALAWCDTSQKIYLEVATYNMRAKAFYEKYNFREKPGTEELFAEVIPTITMERRGKTV
jgi:ribosomal protein S18 acetylase RimI-like enzyme